MAKDSPKYCTTGSALHVLIMPIFLGSHFLAIISDLSNDCKHVDPDETLCSLVPYQRLHLLEVSQFCGVRRKSIYPCSTRMYFEFQSTLPTMF